MFRATLKSLLSRKIRLILSGLAVVLGVMAVAGAFVLSSTLSKSFDSLFSDAYKDVDVEITGKAYVDTTDQGGENVTRPIPADVVSQVGSVDGVRKVYGGVGADGARVVGSNGKVITSNGPPRLGVDWNSERDGFELRSGRAPSAPGEVAINAGLAKTGDFKVGDEIKVLTLKPVEEFKIVGVFGLDGGRDSLGGETYVAFTLPQAQELMLGQKDSFSSITVRADDGVSQASLRDAIKAKIGDEYVVKTGKQASDDQSSQIDEFLDVFRNFLLGFAGVALFVGIFLILNTFSIIVAQRTRELALFRAMGASRGQVIRSVLIEAIVVGIIASTLGLGAGIGLAQLLKWFLGKTGGGDLPDAGIVVPPVAIIASYLVGIIVTVVAAVIPAVRASRIPPIAAMREAEDTQRPLTKLTISGLVATIGGVILVALSLSGQIDGLMPLLIGVLLAFVGIAMLTPMIAKPVVSGIGFLLSWSLSGKLGRRNSARNPRRTAITAAALMIGLALVTGVGVLASSFKASLENLVKTDVSAQLFISGDWSGGTPPTFDGRVIDEAKQLPEVEAAAPMYFDTMADDDRKAVGVMATDVDEFKQMIAMDRVDGQVRSLKSGELLLTSDEAKDRHLSVGDSIELTSTRGGPKQYTLVGTYKETTIQSEPIISVADAKAGFRSAYPSNGFVKVAEGSDVDAVGRELDRLLKDNPEVSVQNQQDLLDQNAQQIDSFLTILYVLLGLAIVIAVLGIVNTLALSILERTRELGLLRAVGMRRSKTMWMVTTESIVISVFGALLGIVVGIALGTAIVKALEDEGIKELALPWGQMLTCLVLAVIVGLFASVLPAIRAARVNVLRAISYE